MTDHLTLEKIVFDGLPTYLDEDERWTIVGRIVFRLRLNGENWWIDQQTHLYTANVMLDQKKIKPVLVIMDPYRDDD